LATPPPARHSGRGRPLTTGRTHAGADGQALWPPTLLSHSCFTMHCVSPLPPSVPVTANFYRCAGALPSPERHHPFLSPGGGTETTSQHGENPTAFGEKGIQRCARRRARSRFENPSYHRKSKSARLFLNCTIGVTGLCAVPSLFFCDGVFRGREVYSTLPNRQFATRPPTRSETPAALHCLLPLYGDLPNRTVHRHPNTACSPRSRSPRTVPWPMGDTPKTSAGVNRSSSWILGKRYVARAPPAVSLSCA